MGKRIKNKKKNYPFFPTIGRLIQKINQRNKKIYVYIFLFTIVSSVLPLFSLAFPKLVIEELSRGDSANFNYLIQVIIALTIGTGLFSFLESYLRGISYTPFVRLRMDYLTDSFKMFNEMEYYRCEDPKFLDSIDGPMRAIMSDGSGIEGIYHKLFELGSKIVIISVYSIIISFVSWWLVLALMMSVIVSWYTGVLIQRYRYSKKDDLAHAERKIQYYTKTTYDFSYGKDIRLYDLGNTVKKKYRHEITNYIRVFQDIKQKEFKLGLIELLAVLASDSVVYFILIYQVYMQTLSIADLSMFLVAVLTLSTTLKLTGEDINFMIGEGMYVNDFFEFSRSLQFDIKDGLPQLKDETLEIEFRHVWFRYPNTEKWILEDVNLIIPRGQKLALVGINGAGKTTIVKLITRLFEPTKGEILINGIPAQKFNLIEYFKMFSVVFQEFVILAMSVRENITLGDHSKGDEFVYDCLRRAGLEEKIRELPKQLDHSLLKIIDETGVEFSGGQNQKLMIARALYKEGNMVILDEPTASLDALAESEIYAKFNDLVLNKTSLYISHRLASTKFCDKIALFGHGKLQEYGTHDELMALQKEYYHMFVTQGKYYQEGAGDQHETV